MTAEPKKILIIKLSSLGDVCLALPHVEVIVNYHAGDDIWIMTSRPYIDFFKYHPCLKTVVLDRSGSFNPESTFGRLRWIRKMQFETVYDLQGNRTSRLLARFCKAPVRVGTQPYAFYTSHPSVSYTSKTQQNIFERLNETLVAAGLPQAQRHADLHLPLRDKEYVASWKASNQLQDKHYVLLHAGCSPEWPSKRWPLEYFCQLASMLEAAGMVCIWIGGKEDRKINQALARATGIDATGVFSLTQLYLVAKEASFAVTNDSGPMHVLAVCGLPVYGFFGPTNYIRSHAIGQRERIITNRVSCSPCFLKTCPPKCQHACLDQILPEQVFDRLSREIYFQL